MLLSSNAFDISLSASFGKIVSPETKSSADESYKVLLSRATIPRKMQLPGTMPLGAGNKPWRLLQDPFVTAPVDNIQTGPDSTLNFY